jgi:hypothetical protein
MQHSRGGIESHLGVDSHRRPSPPWQRMALPILAAGKVGSDMPPSFKASWVRNRLKGWRCPTGLLLIGDGLETTLWLWKGGQAYGWPLLCSAQLLPTMVCLRLRGGASYCTLNLLLGDLLLKFITESICPKMHPSACHGRPGSQAKLLKAGGQPRPTLLWHLEQSFIFPASSKGRGGTWTEERIAVTL